MEIQARGRQGISDYRSLSIGFAILDNLRCWQDNHLHMIKESVQVKYKGKVRRLCGGHSRLSAPWSIYISFQHILYSSAKFLYSLLTKDHWDISGSPLQNCCRMSLGSPCGSDSSTLSKASHICLVRLPSLAVQTVPTVHSVQTVHSPLYLSLHLCIYPAENIWTSAGDQPYNTGECKTPHHRPAKTYFQLFLATPTDTEQWNSSPSGSELHCALSV